MPLYTTEALVLRTYPLGESDRIVVFLTRDRGKRRGVARGARKSVRRFGGALEPLTRVNVSYFEREGRELVRLDFAEPLRSPLAATRPEALDYVGYFAELLDEWTPEHDPAERMFRLGAAAVEAMAAGAPPGALARYFEFWLLRLQGVYPSLAACQRCGGAFGPQGAWLARTEPAFLCAGCASGPVPDLSAAALAFLAAVSSRPPDRLDDLRLDRETGREIEAVHRALIAGHLDREPRSSRVLRELGAT